MNLEINDDSGGFDIEDHFSNSHGHLLNIKLIKDGLELLEGKLSISSSSGGGKTLHAVLPLLEEVSYLQ